jgi:hypothetical protein
MAYGVMSEEGGIGFQGPVLDCRSNLHIHLK